MPSGPTGVGGSRRRTKRCRVHGVTGVDWKMRCGRPLPFEVDHRRQLAVGLRSIPKAQPHLWNGSNCQLLQ